MAKTPRELRKFGCSVGGVFLLLGTISAWRGHVVAPRVLWTLGGLLLTPGLLWPRLLGPIEAGWMRVAAALGYVNIRVILTAMFYGVMTPLGWAIRRFRDPMDRSLDDSQPSHWKRRERSAAGVESYRHQF